MTARVPELLVDGPDDARRAIALAHGAGAPMDSDFMNVIATGLAARGLRVVRFEFPYMAARRNGGPKRPPDREPVLRETWLNVIRRVGAPLIIGGKSLGGRIASLVADQADVAGLVCLGYPFHPTGRPDRLRIDHLKTLRTPALIVQGERDAFGNREEVGRYPLAGSIRVHWLPDGDHSFRPRRSSGRSEAENLSEAVDAVAEFADSLPA